MVNTPAAAVTEVVEAAAEPHAQVKSLAAVRHWVPWLEHPTTAPNDEPGRSTPGCAEAVARIPVQISLVRWKNAHRSEAQNQAGADSNVLIVGKAAESCGHPIELCDAPGKNAVTDVDPSAQHHVEAVSAAASG